MLAISGGIDGQHLRWLATGGWKLHQGWVGPHPGVCLGRDTGIR